MKEKENNLMLPDEVISTLRSISNTALKHRKTRDNNFRNSAIPAHVTTFYCAPVWCDAASGP